MRWILRFPLHSFMLLAFVIGQYSGERISRQVSLDDLIHGALQLVKPIFDTAQPLTVGNSMKRAQIEDDAPLDARQQAALGVQDDAPNRSPICRGNSKICRFIACTAHNFKHDQNFANLNLAAQVLSDKKLRKAVTNNPESVVAVCKDQGLSETQCKIFSQGFQVVDRFINVIEPKEKSVYEVAASDAPDESNRQPSAVAEVEVPEVVHDAPASVVDRPIHPVGRFGQSTLFGSRTWSTHVTNTGHSTARNAMLPRPIVPVTTHHTTDRKAGPFADLGIVTAPIVPPKAAAPSSPTIIERPSEKDTSSSDIGFSTDIDRDQLILARPRRTLKTAEHIIYLNPELGLRTKRAPDYYDQVEEASGNNGRDPVDYEDTDKNPLRPASVGMTRSRGQHVPSGAGASNYTPMDCFSLLG